MEKLKQPYDVELMLGGWPHSSHIAPLSLTSGTFLAVLDSTDGVRKQRDQGRSSVRVEMNCGSITFLQI